MEAALHDTIRFSPCRDVGTLPGSTAELDDELALQLLHARVRRSLRGDVSISDPDPDRDGKPEERPVITRKPERPARVNGVESHRRMASMESNLSGAGKVIHLVVIRITMMTKITT